MATSFDIFLQAEGVILCWIFKSNGSYKDMEEDSRPKATTEFNDLE